MSLLNQTLDDVRNKIRRYRDKGINEENTKTALIHPVIRALGWDIGDLEEVQQEYRRRPRDKPVDYALLLLRVPRLFVEAKALGQNLSDRRWASQIMGYATVAGVEWVVITDGNEYRIYNALAHVPVEEKLFRSVQIADQTGAAAETLALLSKERLNGNDLEHLWQAHFVDRQMKATLEGLFTVDPDPSFVRLVKKKAKDLSTKDIKASLRRVQAAFNFPVDPTKFFEKPTARTSSRKRMPTRTRGPEAARKAWETRRAHVGVCLLDIIKAGLLKPPLKLTRHYKGHDLEAELLLDGTVRFQGEVYKTCSQAGDIARGSITGRRMNTNGWRFWQYRDETGNRIELDAARQEFLKREVKQPSHILKHDRKAAATKEPTETKRLQLEFWSALRARLDRAGVFPSLQTPRPQCWYNFAIGRSGIHLSCIANGFQNRIAVRLYLRGRVAEAALGQLESQRDAIQREIGMELAWNPHPQKQDKIIQADYPADLAKRDKWPEYLEWLTNALAVFRKVFRDRIRALDLPRSASEDVEE